MKKDKLLAALRNKLAEQPQSSEADFRGGFNVIPGGGLSPQGSDTDCSGNTECVRNITCKTNTICSGNTNCEGNYNCTGNLNDRGNTNCNESKNASSCTHTPESSGAVATLSDDILSFGSSL